MAEQPIRFDERAERDLQAAVDWYHEQQAGLGERFVEALDATLARIADFPQMFPVVEGHVRRALTEKFPYSVYFQKKEDGLLVIAVLHTRRSSGVLSERTED